MERSVPDSGEAREGSAKRKKKKRNTNRIGKPFFLIYIYTVSSFRLGVGTKSGSNSKTIKLGLGAALGAGRDSRALQYA